MVWRMNPDVYQLRIHSRSAGPLYQLEYIWSGAARFSGEVEAESGCEPRPKRMRGLATGSTAGTASGGVSLGSARAGVAVEGAVVCTAAGVMLDASATLAGVAG